MGATCSRRELTSGAAYGSALNRFEVSSTDFVFSGSSTLLCYLYATNLISISFGTWRGQLISQALQAQMAKPARQYKYYFSGPVSRPGSLTNQLHLGTVC